MVKLFSDSKAKIIAYSKRQGDPYLKEGIVVRILQSPPSSLLYESSRATASSSTAAVVL